MAKKYIANNSANYASITRAVLHDLASPISSLEGVFNLLEEQELHADARSLLIAGQHAVGQLKRIHHNGYQLLNHEERIDSFNLGEVITTVVSGLMLKIQTAQIDLYLDLEQNVELLGDTGLMERAILNILSNSIEELTQLKSSRKMQIKLFQQGDTARLLIRDNGRGIPTELQLKVFNEDFSTKPDEHQGMGLAFVKDALNKAFNAEVRLFSQVDYGTEFKVEIPV